MKTLFRILILGLVVLSSSQCSAQRVVVISKTDDISNNLDLKAVASVFGDARNLEDFERRLNDYDNPISNLDFNNDGEIDYLRVIEVTEQNAHVVVVQAVVGKDVYQDVATIVVDKYSNGRPYVQVIGNSYLYGANYIVEPIYDFTPVIYSSFWRNGYSRWYSPYTWGYYPNYYHVRRPYTIDVYRSHVCSHVNVHHRYNYTHHIYHHDYDRIHNSIRRNDYETRYPDKSYYSRNRTVDSRSHSYPSSSYHRSGSEQRISAPTINSRRETTPATDRRVDVTTPAPSTRSYDNSRARTAAPNTESERRTPATVTPPSRSSESRSSVIRDSQTRAPKTKSNETRSSESRSSETRSPSESRLNSNGSRR